MKKAQIEVSFNWIFVLLAGFAILFFFYIIITSQTETSRETLSRTIVQRMGAVFDSMQANPNTAEVHNRVTFEIDFTCINGVHEFRRGQSASGSYLDHSIIFTPKRIGNSELLTQTIRMNFPFLTNSALLLSDRRTLYFFNEANRYYNMLDDLFEKAQGTYEQAEGNATSYRRVIFVTTNKNNIGINRPNNLDYVVINETEGTLNISGTQFNYSFSDQITLGAIIAGDYDLTMCNFEKINQSFERLKFIINDRMENMSTMVDDRCANLMQENIITYNFSMKYDDYLLDYYNLETVNRNIERLGCPTIY